MNNSISEIARIWQQTLKVIDKKLDERAIFDSFFANSYIQDIKGNTVTVAVGSATAERLLSSRYVDIIKDSLSEVTDNNYDLVFVQQDSIAKSNTKNIFVQKEESEPSFFKDAKLDTNLTFDSFVEGAFNIEAYRAASVVAKNPGQAFNPLFIYSNSGLGKTHLLHAIGNKIQAKSPKAKILYIDANDFVDEYVKYVKGEKESETLKDFFSSIDVLLLDDVQFLQNKVKTEEMFFYIYQKMINNNKQVVITSDRQPTELKGLEDRLVTRFSQGLTVNINNPDQATCVKILEKQIENAGLVAQEDGWTKTTSKLSFESDDKIYSYITPEGYLLDWQIVFTHFQGSDGKENLITFLYNEKNKSQSKQIEFSSTQIIPDLIWEKYVEIYPQGFLNLPTKFFFDKKKINSFVKTIKNNILEKYENIDSTVEEENYYKEIKILIHEIKKKIRREREIIENLPENKQNLIKKEENKQNIENMFENINK